MIDIIKELYIENSPFFWKGNIILYGAGGVGKVWLDKLKANNNNVKCFIDDYKEGKIDGIPIYSTIKFFKNFQQARRDKIFITIGDTYIAQEVKNRLEDKFNVLIIDPPMPFIKNFYYYSLIKESYAEIKRFKFSFKDNLSQKNFEIILNGIKFLIDFFNETNSDIFLFEKIIRDMLFEFNKNDNYLDFNNYNDICSLGINEFITRLKNRNVHIFENKYFDLMKYKLDGNKNLYYLNSVNLEKFFSVKKNITLLIVQLSLDEWKIIKNSIFKYIDDILPDFIINIPTHLPSFNEIVTIFEKNYNLRLVNNELNFFTGFKLIGLRK